MAQFAARREKKERIEGKVTTSSLRHWGGRVNVHVERRIMKGYTKPAQEDDGAEMA